MKIGDSIKKLRIEKGLKQKDLAKEVNLTPVFLSKVEKNETKPSWHTLSLIAEKLGVTVSHLILSSITKGDLIVEEKSNYLKVKHHLELLFNDVESFLKK